MSLLGPMLLPGDTCARSGIGEDEERQEYQGLGVHPGRWYMQSGDLWEERPAGYSLICRWRKPSLSCIWKTAGLSWARRFFL